jgi:hypothetical protein
VSKKIDKATEEVSQLIDRLGDPARMSKREWVEFLASIIWDCNTKKEAAEQELAEGT